MHIERAQKSEEGGVFSPKSSLQSGIQQQGESEKNPSIWKSVEIIFIDIVIFFYFLIAFLF